MADDKDNLKEENLQGGLGRVDKLNDSLNGVSDLFKQFNPTQTTDSGSSSGTGAGTTNPPQVQPSSGNQSSTP